MRGFVVMVVLATSVAATTHRSSAAGPVGIAESLPAPARTEYELGRTLYRSGDFAGALAKFDRAYALGGDPRLLWNMAACEKSLRHYRNVLADVDKYLATGGALLTEADRKEARAFREAVQALVSEVTFDVSEPGATITIDDDELGTAPLAAPVVLDAGARRVRVWKRGFREVVRNEQIPGGTPVTISVKLVREVLDGRVTIVARDAEAISVDGRTVGTTEWSGALAAGSHVVVVQAHGKKPARRELVLRDGEVRTLTIDLERDGGSSWPWIVAGGVVVATGAVVGGYFLLRPSRGDEAPVSGNAGRFQLP